MPRASQEVQESPRPLIQSPTNSTGKVTELPAPAASPEREAKVSDPAAMDEPQLSKVAILLAFEKVDAEIEAVNAKLAALNIKINKANAR